MHRRRRNQNQNQNQSSSSNNKAGGGGPKFDAMAYVSLDGSGDLSGFDPAQMKGPNDDDDDDVNVNGNEDGNGGSNGNGGNGNRNGNCGENECDDNGDWAEDEEDKYDIRLAPLNRVSSGVVVGGVGGHGLMIDDDDATDDLDDREREIRDRMRRREYEAQREKMHEMEVGG